MFILTANNLCQITQPPTAAREECHAKTTARFECFMICCLWMSIETNHATRGWVRFPDKLEFSSIEGSICEAKTSRKA